MKRPLVFLFPNNRMDIGGNSAQMRFMEACGHSRAVTAVQYSVDRRGKINSQDFVRSNGSEPIYVIHWGPDVPQLLAALNGKDVIYFAHSTGWRMRLPSYVPILCVSRHTMAYWGRYAPNSYIAHVPNIVEVKKVSTASARDIDVLVQVRKSSRYLLEQLVPALQDRCRVTVIDGWVDDLTAWFQRSKVYLYDSLEHWIDVGATEGFGLPPLEALANGCMVFSGVNDALADYLDPGFNCRKLRVHSLQWDVAAILDAIRNGGPCSPDSLFHPYTTQQVTGRLSILLSEIQRFFEVAGPAERDIEDLWEGRRPSALQRLKGAAKVLCGASHPVPR
ncbi:glycosyltransferase family 4 protein [Novosphingobium panipatense]|uniref:Glycosyl transferases group 1 n=1 Tax=Novosphingobium panipatense TaxID=428991 RepID=A0ABY1QIZ2_9SPHN|nr:hypothetical protein [Novosphingobium panipatense]SMP72241.1 Glycosyl transferases group 1 [Novosphingobium panipatense]